MREMKKAGCVAGVLLLLLGDVARAAEPPVYTLEDCIRLGQERSAAMRIARRDREIGDALVAQARSDALPQLSLSGTYTRLDELQEIDLGAPSGAETSGDIAESSFAVGSLDNYEATAAVNQLLFSGGRVRSAIRAARFSRDYYDRSGAAAETELKRDIRLAFHAILYARDALDVRRESVSNLAAHVEQATLKHETGTLSEFDLISARVRLGNEKPALIAASNAYALARAELGRILNLDDPGFTVRGALVFEPPAMGLDSLQRLAQTSRPQLQQLRSVVDLRAADAAAAGADRWPDFRAFFRYTESNPYGFAGEEDEWEGHWTAGLTVEWDLWNGGRTGAIVREKKLEVEKARIRLDDTRAAVRLHVEQAYLAMQHAARAVEAGDGNIAQARKAFEIARNRYASGLGTQLEFMDSTVALREAQLIRLAALRDTVDAVARLQYACGLQERDLYVEMTPGAAMDE